VHVKISSGSTPKGRNVVSRKSPLGWINMSAHNFFVSGPKFNFFHPATVLGGLKIQN